MRSPRTVKTATTSAAAVAALLLLAGCGAAAEKVSEKATEQAIESQTGGDVDIDTDGEGSVDIETEDGSLSFGTGEIPEEWPQDVPVPEGIEVLSGTTMDASDGKLVSITATSDRSPEELLAELKETLGDWEISGESTMTSTDGDISGAQWDTDGRRFTMAASNGGDGTETSLTMGHTTLG